MCIVRFVLSFLDAANYQLLNKINDTIASEMSASNSKGILVFADISGYTRFSRLHYTSLLHAEQIISELLDSIILNATLPLTIGQLEGDAVLLYIDTDSNTVVDAARDVLLQVQKFFAAFNERERALIACDAGCVCEACSEIGELRLKAVVHFGEYKHGTFKGVSEINGADVTFMQALLKAPLPEREHIILTESFYALAGGLPEEMRHEFLSLTYNNINTSVHLYLPKIQIGVVPVPERAGPAFSLRLNQYSFGRMLLNKPRASFNNLPEVEMNLILYLLEGIASGLNVLQKSISRIFNFAGAGITTRAAMLLLVEIRSPDAANQRLDVELLKKVLEIARPSLILNKLEDRAAFLYSVAGSDKALLAENLYRQAQRMYDIFQDQPKDSSDPIFRAFFHFGEVAVKKVADFEELAGLPVILIHRLMQNAPVTESAGIFTKEFAKYISGETGLSSTLVIKEFGEIKIHIAKLV